MSERRHHRVLIIGGGTAGISVAARLKNADAGLDVAIVEPATTHYYQPLWTLVGGGVYPAEASGRPMESVIPPGVPWIRDAVVSFDPEKSEVALRDGGRVGYDWLVVAPGLQINWGQIEGLREAIGRGGVCSNYAVEHAAYTWECIRDFRGGTALFTQPSGAVKCGGAPQKIMYLAEETFRKRGIRGKSRVVFATATARIFAVDKYARALERIVVERGIETRLKHELKAVETGKREALFQNLDTGEEVRIAYDLLHVTPPMGPPAFVAQSPLADPDGWLDVDKYSLRHTRYGNVFGIGDASNLPTSKTGAAIRKQAPALVANLRAAMAGRTLEAAYDGYTSCPLVTGYNSLILAEFDYDKQPKETFPFDQGQPRSSMYLLKAYGLPQLYWHGMLKGRM